MNLTAANSGRKKMSAYRDYVEQNHDTIGSDWQKHMCDVNEERRRQGLSDKIFSEKDRENFERAWVDSKSI